MLFAIVMGTFAGTALAFFLSKWLLREIADRHAPAPGHRNIVRITGAVFGAIALAPAIFLSVMAGGGLATRYAAIVARAMGLGEAGLALVLAAELIAAVALMVAAHVAVGAAIGVLFSRSLTQKSLP
jgi:hypothetical protein